MWYHTLVSWYDTIFQPMDGQRKCKMEVWDLYTEGRIKTGETHLRGTALPKNRFHLVVHVWIVNAKGEYLIS